MVWAETPVRLDLGESYVTDRGQGIGVQLRLNRATAYGLRLRDNPMMLSQICSWIWRALKPIRAVMPWPMLW